MISIAPVFISGSASTEIRPINASGTARKTKSASPSASASPVTR